MKIKSTYLIFVIILLSNTFFSETDSDSFEKCQELIDAKQYDEAIILADKNLVKFQNEKDVLAQLDMLGLKAKAYTHQYNFEEGMDIYKKLTTLAKTHNFTEEYANGLSSQSALLVYKSEFQKALTLEKEILAIRPEVDNKIRSNSFTAIGGIFNNLGIVDSSIYYAQKAVDIDLLSEDKSSLPFSLLTLGHAYKLNGDNLKALNTFIEATNHLRIGKDEYKMATINKVIAETFLRLNNFDKAEFYIDKAIDIAKQEDIILTLSYCKYTKSLILKHKNNPQESQLLLKEALTVFEDKDRKDRAIECYSQLAMFAIESDQLEKANLLIDKAYISYNQMTEPRTIFSFILADTKLKIAEKKYTNALQLLNQINLEKLLDNNPRLHLRYLEELSNIHVGLSNHKLALDIINKKYVVKNKLDKINQERLVTELEAKYHKMEDAKEIEKLNQKNEINTLLVQKKNNLILAILIFSFLALIAFVFIFKQNKKITSMNTELLINNKKIVLALQEKEILLKEIHHRVKNNLQIVSSLLNMQSREVSEQTAKDALTESKNRVHSMAIIHQELYQLKDLVGINSKNYIEKLTTSLLQSYKTTKGNITMTNDVDIINLDIETSIPIGLIINELVTNSLKYAFPNDMEGQIELKLKKHPDYIELTITDNGIGLAQDKKSTGSFGLKMVRIFAQKLNAEWDIINNNGTTVSLKIKNFKIA